MAIKAGGKDDTPGPAKQDMLLPTVSDMLTIMPAMKGTCIQQNFKNKINHIWVPLTVNRLNSMYKQIGVKDNWMTNVD